MVLLKAMLLRGDVAEGKREEVFSLLVKYTYEKRLQEMPLFEATGAFATFLSCSSHAVLSFPLFHVPIT